MKHICWQCMESVEDRLLIPVKSFRICHRCKDMVIQQVKEGQFSLEPDGRLAALIETREREGYAIIVCNTSGYMSAAPVEVYVDGDKVCTLKRKEYTVLPLTEGEHEIVAQHKEAMLPIWYTDRYHLTFENRDCCLEVFAKPTSTGCQLNEDLPDPKQTKRFVEPTPAPGDNDVQP